MRRQAIPAGYGEPHRAALDDRDLLVWMRVHLGDHARRDAQPADHQLIAPNHLTLDAVSGIVLQLLPPDVQQTLERLGAVQHTVRA